MLFIKSLISPVPSTDVLVSARVPKDFFSFENSIKFGGSGPNSPGISYPSTGVKGDGGVKTVLLRSKN